MQRRSFWLNGSFVLAVIIMLAVSIFALRARTVLVSIGVANYVQQTNGLFAYMTLTNHGNVTVAVPLRYWCEVVREGGSTNYTADTRYTIFLQPAQMTLLTHTNFAIPLPPDTRTWTVELQVRQQTRKESLINTLYGWGVVTPRMLSKLSRPPGKDETFRWTVCHSGSFEVALELPEKSRDSQNMAPIRTQSGQSSAGSQRTCQSRDQTKEKARAKARAFNCRGRDAAQGKDSLPS
jgi:hypothetical protein